MRRDWWCLCRWKLLVNDNQVVTHWSEWKTCSVSWHTSPPTTSLPSGVDGVDFFETNLIHRIRNAFIVFLSNNTPVKRKPQPWMHSNLNKATVYRKIRILGALVQQTNPTFIVRAGADLGRRGSCMEQLRVEYYQRAYVGVPTGMNERRHHGNYTTLGCIDFSFQGWIPVWEYF